MYQKVVVYNGILSINIESNYNYSYDEEGRLIKDVQENIEIEWRVDGKVKNITRIVPDSDQKNVSFDYEKKHSF